MLAKYQAVLTTTFKQDLAHDHPAFSITYKNGYGGNSAQEIGIIVSLTLQFSDIALATCTSVRTMDDFALDFFIFSGMWYSQRKGCKSISRIYIHCVEGILYFSGK